MADTRTTSQVARDELYLYLRSVAAQAQRDALENEARAARLAAYRRRV